MGSPRNNNFFIIYSAHYRDHRGFSHVYARAVSIIDNIDVSIKKSCNIHIDTEIWISILIDIESSKSCCFLCGGLHHGGSKPSFHTPGLYALDILSFFSDSYIKVLPNRNLKQTFHAPVEHYPYHRAATQLTCNHNLTGTIGLYQYLGTIAKMHKCMKTYNPQSSANQLCNWIGIK